MRLDQSQLMGLSRTAAELMGKPHLGARYTGSGVNTHRKDNGAMCAVCGRPATETHHVVPKGKAQGFTVNTPIGRFVVKTPLFALCRGCHAKFHEKRISVEWCWSDGQYEDEWWSGHTLAHICRPHDSFLFQEGYYLLRSEEGERILG